MATVSAQSFLGGQPATLVGNETSTEIKKTLIQPKPSILQTVKDNVKEVVDKTATDLDKRVTKVQESTFASQDGQVGEQTGLETKVQQFGQGLAFAGDIVGNIISSFTPDSIKDPAKKLAIEALQTPIGKVALEKIQQGSEAYDAWKSESPEHERIARNIDAAFSIGSAAADAAGAGAGKKVVSEGVDVAVDLAKKTAEEAAKKGKQIVNDIPAKGEVVGDVMSAVGEKTGSKGIRNMGDTMKEKATIRKDLKQEGPSAVRVFDETGSKEYVDAIKKTKSTADLEAKRKMLDVVEERMSGSASKKLPRQVVADEYIAPRIDSLKGRLDQLGKTIGKAKEDKTVVDTTDLVNSMIADAAKQGVIVTPSRAGFKFGKAQGVSGIDSARVNSVKNVFDGFKSTKDGTFSNTIAQLSATRKNLSDLTKRSDAAKEVVSPGGPIDNARRLIAQKIGGDYFQATKDYSDIARVLEQLDPDLKVRLSEDALKEITSVKLGDYARRLLSNNAAQAKATFKSLDELFAKEASRKGEKVPEQDLEDLVDFAGALEEGFGITPRNTFFGQVSGGALDAAGRAVGSIPTTAGGAVQSVANIFNNPKINNKRALEAMRAFIDDSMVNREP